MVAMTVPSSQVVVSPNRPNIARLWALLPLLFNKCYLCPDPKIVEPFVQHAVAVEVDDPDLCANLWDLLRERGSTFRLRTNMGHPP
jgi:hypothetical protein